MPARLERCMGVTFFWALACRAIANAIMYTKDLPMCEAVDDYFF
jgi:hypothetical protein